MSRPRLLVVLSSRVRGGVEVKARSIVRRLADLRPAILTNREIAPSFADSGGEVLPFVEDRASLAPGALRSAAVAVREAARECGADVILAMNPRSVGYVRLSRAFFGLALPYVGTVESQLSAELGHATRLTRLLGDPLLDAAYGGAAPLVAPSSGVADDLRARGVAPSRIHCIPNGVDLDEVRRAAGVAIVPRRPRITTVCRLSAPKDVETLLRAFARVHRRHDAELYVVGGGPRRSRLEAMARELGVERDVVFTGQLDNPHPIVAASRLFVLSSRSEAFGLVLVEALALGVPVVATDAPSGPREILEPDELCPVGDAEALAAVIERRLATAPLGDDARSALRNRAAGFGADAMACAYGALLEATSRA